MYSMKDFMELLINNPCFLEPLSQLKDQIIDNILTKGTYNRIIRKKNYYEKNDIVLNTYPTECFCVSVIRRYFFLQPHPYFANYYPYSVNDQGETVLYTICSRYCKMRSMRSSINTDKQKSSPRGNRSIRSSINFAMVSERSNKPLVRSSINVIHVKPQKCIIIIFIAKNSDNLI